MYDEIKSMLEEKRKIPYPEYKVLNKNIKFANMLRENFAGGDGELSAITQYIYEHIITNEELSSILLSIAIEEMKHLNIVGELVTQYGGRPIYANYQGELWNADNVKYDIYDLKDLMKYNIKSEELAIEGYKKAMNVTNNITVKKLLDRIIYDEKIHKNIFEMIYKTVE